MTRRTPLKLGAAFAVTVGLGYALCTLVFWLRPEAAAAFMNALFHGLDFTPLANATAFTFGSFATAFVVFVAWAFMLGSVFAWVADRMTGET
jgi:hypothetical protein